MFDKKSILNFECVKELLSLSTLVYDFGINLILTKDISNNLNLSTLDISKLKINNLQKKQLSEIIKESPKAELYKFYDLESGNQVGITIGHIKKRIVFIFRGSNEINDWLHNFLICKREIKKDCFVHLGFYKFLTSNNLLNNLIIDLKYLIGEYDYDIHITGHSLGGGLSTLFGYLISDLIDKNITITTFASPRVGNYHWVQDFNSKSNLRLYRIVNNRDIVTAIPYTFFHHVGNYIFIDKNKMIYEKYNTFNDKNNIIYSFNPFDHNIEEYYENLLRCKWCKFSEII